MSNVIDIRQSDDPSDVIHQAVRLLSEGELVALPTETVYMLGAYGLSSAAIEKMHHAVNGLAESTYGLILKGADEALDYVPEMSGLGKRLIRRCWPGPVIISFDVSTELGLLNALPPAAYDAVVSSGRIELQVPAHDVVQDILRLMPAPLLTTGERRPSKPAATVADMRDRFDPHVAMFIDDGTCRYGEHSTVIHVEGNHWTLIEAGVVTETMLSRLASRMYLFVCTGNTCRSPMAEGLFRKFLAVKLQCLEEEVVDRGHVVLSSGLAAAYGAPASSESIDAAAEKGVDLRGHVSQPLTDRLLDQADHIYTMTRGHRDSIIATRPEMADRVHLLSRTGDDILDPIGAGPQEYRRCEQEIETHLRSILEDIDIENG